MRWKHWVVGLGLTLAGLAGCKQQCFIHECDYDHYQYHLGLPPNLENNPSASVTPTTVAMPEPSTVRNPDRAPRHLTLSEAIAMALENGNIGSQTTTNPGLARDDLIGFTGRGLAGSDSIRVLAMDPAVSAADIEAALSKFDAVWQTSMTWNNTDSATSGSFVNQFQPNGESATFRTGLIKPLPTGGVAGITFDTVYNFRQNATSIGGLPNPVYTDNLQFQFEQPLLQGFGVEINQLRAAHPGGTQPGLQIPTGGRVEGILITRLRFDQQRAQFQSEVHFLLLNVEAAYWNLYDAYWTLYAREQALRQAFEAWKINKARYEAGRTNIQDFAQTRQQYELFRGQRLSALGQVLENERQLRALIGLPGEDGTRLIPIDAPTLTPYEPDWATAANEALAMRPELVIAREDLKFRQLDVINAKNLLLPDLRLISSYGLNGLGSRLDGVSGNAFRSLASDRFTDWTVGLRLNVSLGYRDAHAQTRVARLNLARSYLTLQDEERKALRLLEQQYRRLFEFHQQIEIQRSQREAAAAQLKARFDEFLAGRGTLDILLEAQRVWSEALRSEYDFISQYNIALAGFEFAKGTILQHDNVSISEGTLPQCAQKRAVEHERERSKAIVLRERANPLVSATCDPAKGCYGILDPPANEAPSLLRVQDGIQPVPIVKELLKPGAAPASTAERMESVPTSGAITAAPGETTTGTIFLSETPVAASTPKSWPATLPSLPAPTLGGRDSSIRRP